MIVHPRIELRGDRDRAQRLAHAHLERLLLQFRWLTNFQKLKINQQRVNFFDDQGRLAGVVYMQTVHGLERVVIEALPVSRPTKRRRLYTATQKRYLPAVQLYNATGEVPPPRKWGDPLVDWMKPTKMGLLISLDEESFNGPYVFLPVQAENFRAKSAGYYSTHTMDWDNSLLPPFHWDCYHYNYNFNATLEAEIRQLPERIPLGEIGPQQFSLVFQPVFSSWAGLDWIDSCQNNSVWTGGGTKTDHAYAQDISPPDGGTWNEMIWWPDGLTKTIFRAMRSLSVNTWSKTEWRPERRHPETGNWEYVDEVVFDTTYTETGQMDVSYRYALWGAGLPHSQLDQYNACVADMVAWGAYDDLNAPYPRFCQLVPQRCVQWHQDRVGSWEYLGEEDIAFIPDSSEGKYCAVLAYIDYPPTNPKWGPYEEANKDLYWTATGGGTGSGTYTYPASLRRPSYRSSVDWPPHNRLFVDGPHSIELECGVDADWASTTGGYVHRGAQFLRYWDTEAGTIVGGFLNDYMWDYPSSTHRVNFFLYKDGAVVHGPLFGEDNTGMFFAPPEHYFDYSRHIWGGLEDVLPKGYEDCFWCLGEMRLVEVTETTERVDES